MLSAFLIMFTLGETVNLFFDEVAKLQEARGVPFSAETIRRFVINNVELPEIIVYKNIPGLAPPFPIMWFEWSPPIEKVDLDILCGLLMISTQKYDGWEYMAAGWISSKAYGKGAKMLPYALKFHIPVSGKIEYFEYQPYIVKPAPHVLDRHPNVSEEEIIDVFVDGYMAKVFFAIGLLHCKNIVQIEKGGKNPNIKNRRHRSKGTKHYVLDVIPARNIKRAEHEQPAKGSPQRIHFRRGHFKEYTSEKPLFGKYTGAFWWEAHVAGSADIGEVRKDYRILPMQQ
jgi:hypothetical protein